MYPITGIAECCASAKRGHAANPPPITLMKSRRLMLAPRLRTGHCIKQNADTGIGFSMSALGQKQTCALHSPMSALPPKRHQMRHMECPLRAKSGHSNEMHPVDEKSWVALLRSASYDILPTMKET